MPSPKETWEAYVAEELAAVVPLLEALGYDLEKQQPHLGGERYLMQAVTTASGKKLILLGKERVSGRRAVIKVTSDPEGKRELSHERLCRAVLKDIGFAYTVFLSPEELRYAERNGYAISIQAFIEQESSFLARPLEEQFAIALRAFKAQEGAHAATYGHVRRIERTFGRMTAPEYRKRFHGFLSGVATLLPQETGLHRLLREAADFFAARLRTVEQYQDFLTHTDFVPHNFRVVGNDLYLLDHSSLRFGNKHEGWARFANFMALHNPSLAEALGQYVRDNRAPEEVLSFKLMRVYRLAEIIWYYANTLPRSEDDLRTLNSGRVSWWTHVLESVLADRAPDETVRLAYVEERDRLRTNDEKARQKDLH